MISISKIANLNIDFEKNYRLKSLFNRNNMSVGRC